MIIKMNEARTYAAGGVTLMPGMNHFDKAPEELLAAHGFQHRCRVGVITVTDDGGKEIKPPEPAPARVQTVTPLSVPGQPVGNGSLAPELVTELLLQSKGDRRLATTRDAIATLAAAGIDAG